jgi:alpha-galactosidase
MNIKLILALSFIISNYCFAQQKNSIAQSPPLGWNSYNCYGNSVQDVDIMANAKYMAENLKPFGWQYIVVDILWFYEYAPGNFKIDTQAITKEGAYIPWMAMDKYGRLLPHPNKFPTSVGEKGFKPLADYVHSQGLKFGIHVMRGIPRQAVWAKSPILGTKNITADMIADTTSVCPWSKHMYGLKMDKPGAQAYINSLFKLYTSWQIDFIKVDDIAAEKYREKEIDGYRKAINKCGSDIVLSLSPGETPIENKKHVAANANMWRIANDFWDEWPQMLKMFEHAKKWEGIGGAGHWPDCDMMLIGKLSKRGPVGEERYSKFTEDELRTHFTFWSIYKSPLILGGNLPETRPQELKLYTNEEVLKVNQEGLNPREVFKDSTLMIWIADVPNSKDQYMAVFNIGNETKKNSIFFSTFGFTKKISIRDLWQQKEMGNFETEYEIELKKHSAVLLKIKNIY